MRGFEPHSCHFNLGPISSHLHQIFAITQVLRMPGVEPGSQAWEACMMPLHYMRDVIKAAARRPLCPSPNLHRLQKRIISSSSLPRPAACRLSLLFRTWPRGPMDKASAYGAGDCRFESCRGHFLSSSPSHWLASSPRECGRCAHFLHRFSCSLIFCDSEVSEGPAAPSCLARGSSVAIVRLVATSSVV